MYISGMKNFEKTVNAQESEKGILIARVKIDAYAVENAEWGPGEKENFIRRVEETCCEVHDWLENQIGTDAQGE